MGEPTSTFHVAVSAGPVRKERTGQRLMTLANPFRGNDYLFRWGLEDPVKNTDECDGQPLRNLCVRKSSFRGFEIACRP